MEEKDTDVHEGLQLEAAASRVGRKKEKMERGQEYDLVIDDQVRLSSGSLFGITGLFVRSLLSLHTPGGFRQRRHIVCRGQLFGGSRRRVAEGATGKEVRALVARLAS